jgi:membrane protease YdiL (CAAX protease family)
MFNKPISEVSLIGILACTIVFYTLMFDQTFGLIYSQIALAWFILYAIDRLWFNKKESYPLERDAQGRGMDILVAIAAYAVFLVISSLITNFFNPQQFSSMSVYDVIKSMSALIYQATSPILKDSIILMVLGWGLIIPILETSLFNGRMFEFLKDRFNKRNILATSIILVLLIGSAATLYHLSAKPDSTQLMITFVFFSISGFLVLWRKDLRAAIAMHILGNGLAVLSPYIFK